MRRAEPRVRLALELERRLERRLGAPVQYHFQGAERQRRPFGQLAGQSVHRFVETLVRYGPGDQAPGLGALGGDALAGHHEELAARHAHEPERALGAAAPRDHAQPHLRKRELGPERGHTEVARDSQLETGPHRIPVDRGDDWLPAPLGGGERVAPQLEIGGGQREELGHVAAGAERLAAGATNNHDPHGLVALEGSKDPRELVSHRDRHRVHLRLAVDPDGRDGAGALDAQELAHGRTSVYRPSRSSRRSILPEAVFGISVTKTKRRGRLKLASSPLARQCRSSMSAVSPGAATTNATTRSPHFSSGSPITATSFTPSRRARTSSISTGWMFSPPLMIMSSTRPATQRSPSESSQPMSPVKYQPSRSARASASGRFQ